VRRRKIDPRVQDAFQFPVIMKFGPVVRRDGFDSLAFLPQQFDRPIQGLFLGGALDRSHPYQACFPFHHRHHVGLAATVNRVNLPTTPTTRTV
jgi:hypothetical protein